MAGKQTFEMGVDGNYWFPRMQYTSGIRMALKQGLTSWCEKWVVNREKCGKHIHSCRLGNMPPIGIQTRPATIQSVPRLKVMQIQHNHTAE